MFNCIHLSCTFCFRDRKDLVDLINQLSSGEELLGLELINEDSNSQEIEKPIIDTGQAEATTSEENSTDNTSSNYVKIEKNEQENTSINADISLKSTDDQENANNLETKINTDQDEQDIFEKRDTNLTNIDTQVSEETNHPFDDSEKFVDDKESKIFNQSEGGKIQLDEAATNNLEENNSKQNISNSQNIILDSAKTHNDLVSIPALTETATKCDYLLPSQISETTNPSETSKLNVAEEIKQRSLCKAGVNLSSSKGKTNKSSTGSKLDVIFSRKLEQSTSVFSTDNSKALPKICTSSSEKPENSNFEDNKCIIIDSSIDLRVLKDNEFGQASSVNSEPFCKESTIKRKPDEHIENPSKKKCLDVEHEVGEEIEEPLMIIRGEGSGEDCDTGNPGTDSGENDTTKENLSKKSCLSEAVNNQGNPTSCSEGVSVMSCNAKTSQEIKSELEVRNNIVGNASSELDKSIEEQLSAITGESMSPKQNKIQDNSLNTCLANTKAHKSDKQSGVIDPINTKSPETKNNKLLNDAVDIFGTEQSTSPPIEGNKNDKDTDQSISGNGNISVSEKNNVEWKEIINSQQTVQNKENKSCEISNRIILNDSQSKNVDGLLNVKQIDSVSVNIDPVSKTSGNSLDLTSSSEKNANSAESNTSLNSKLKSATSLLFHDNKETNDQTPGEKVGAIILNPDTRNIDLCDVSKDTIRSDDSNIDLVKEESSNLQLDESDSKEFPVENGVTSKVIDSPVSNNISNEFSVTSQEKDSLDVGKKKNSPAKKIPKRKKLFSPRSKKRINKSQVNSSTKETSNETCEETVSKNDKNVIEAKSELEDVKCTVNDKDDQHDTNKKNKLPLRVEKKTAEINRKRRNSRKNTGTEKDSEDDNVSERNEEVEDEEIGGKRRKIKGALLN